MFGSAVHFYASISSVVPCMLCQWSFALFNPLWTTSSQENATARPSKLSRQILLPALSALVKNTWKREKVGRLSSFWLPFQQCFAIIVHKFSYIKERFTQTSSLRINCHRNPFSRLIPHELDVLGRHRSALWFLTISWGGVRFTCNHLSQHTIALL